MIRTLLWILAGLFLGGIIHILVILSLPTLATQSVWSRIEALGPMDEVHVIPAIAAGKPNPLHLDPEMSYAVCRMDLKSGPGVVSGTLPDAFWSLAVFGSDGTVIYSTTNRDGIGTTLNLGIFDPAQTRLLAQQKFDVSDGLLIVEAPRDDVFVLVRLTPPHAAMRQRYEQALGGIECGNIDMPGPSDAPSGQ